MAGVWKPLLRWWGRWRHVQAPVTARELLAQGWSAGPELGANCAAPPRCGAAMKRLWLQNLDSRFGRWCLWFGVPGFCAQSLAAAADATSLWSDELYSVSKSFQPDFGALLATKPLPLRMLYFGRGGGLRLFLQPFLIADAFVCDGWRRRWS